MLVDSASCYKNEMRTAFGMVPLPELAGQLAMSSNKTNAENNKSDPGYNEGEEDPPPDDSNDSDDNGGVEE